jgi:hypothetical protein
MRIEAAMTKLDRPVSIYEPTAGAVSVLRDLPVAVRDGTVLGG